MQKVTDCANLYCKLYICSIVHSRTYCTSAAWHRPQLQNKGKFQSPALRSAPRSIDSGIFTQFSQYMYECIGEALGPKNIEIFLEKKGQHVVFLESQKRSGIKTHGQILYCHLFSSGHWKHIAQTDFFGYHTMMIRRCLSFLNYFNILYKRIKCSKLLFSR